MDHEQYKLNEPRCIYLLTTFKYLKPSNKPFPVYPNLEIIWTYFKEWADFSPAEFEFNITLPHCHRQNRKRSSGVFILE